MSVSFQLTRYVGVLAMPARDAAAVGLFLLVLADVGLSPEEILVAEGYPHFQATATLLLRDDFELPIERIVQLLDSYAKVSHHIFHLSDVDEMPAPQNNFHFVTLTVSA